MSLHSQRIFLRSIVSVCLMFPGLAPFRAQSISSEKTVIPVAIRFSAIEANAPPGSCGCFWLKGAAADGAIPVLPRISTVVEAGGNTVARVPGTSRGLSEITLFAGPRYTLPFRRFSFGVQALFGAVRGFDADFSTGTRRMDTSTNFGMAAGTLVDVPVRRHISLRAQADFLQTNLPNGADNRQHNLRIGTGLVFRVPLPSNR